MLGFYPLASAPIADDANVSVSVTLSGVQATGQLGTAAVYAEAIVSPWASKAPVLLAVLQ
jgi:hypothetical protein